MKTLIVNIWILSILIIVSCGSVNVKEDAYRFAYDYTTTMLERDPSFAMNVCKSHNKILDVKQLYQDLIECNQQAIKGVYDAITDYCERVTSL